MPPRPKPQPAWDGLHEGVPNRKHEIPLNGLPDLVRNPNAYSSDVLLSTLLSAKGGFSADIFLELWGPQFLPKNNDFRGAIVRAFGLEPTDDYVYHAIASVTLTQVQVAIDHGNKNGMHAWYRNEEGQQIQPPPSTDIEAYTQIFSPTTSTTRAITALASNAKKGSVRASVAENLQSKLILPPAARKLSLPAKAKSPTIKNPYYDIWAWSSQCLEWGGPNRDTEKTKQSHHILPVLYHHFGCVCPSWDALNIIQQLSKPPKEPPRPIVEIGSGNGYWAFLLRRMGLIVYPVDNALSEWRFMWIKDTIIHDGVRCLQGATSRVLGGKGCPNAILLLVYPQVSNDFTGKVIRAYEGDTIVVAGTQNGNGYTGFKDEQIDTWMARERPQFEKVVQIPLPSFAGKDEALFVFCRKKE